ncbi:MULTISPECIES: fasciclin domain-containing protein [Prauserella salsuginis group]|uniref:Fasciclin domain-containing protein n=1 Tax=Prauserella salsuginis TaxID=387889 RepID=A0ABW6G8Y7_9PSEU|nr:MULTISPECIES: fasciclin domain-containing protein [Prauserella salsuginis group]MCR3722501.1 Uncaracterized surface protein containing fasciclin (FAS1) repeats [Prauserella flava]MCR3736943.1 Uncaracterized surface protein containing fasciclin (FAS1) repeats [Prauserella salsuginis]
MRTIRRQVVVTGAVAALALGLSACGGAEDTADQGEQGGGQDQASSSAPPSSSGNGGMNAGMTTADDVFGPGCSQVPTDPNDEGSVQGMVDDPVGTAASNNPLLTKLTAAVKAAGLVDTLNKQDANYTVFAPADPAFGAIPADQLDALLNDPEKKDDLTKTLTFHVVPERMDAAGLVEAGSVESVEGGDVKIGGTADAPTVNGAKVLCGNVPTANATVFVIDEVLQPGKQ